MVLQERLADQTCPLCVARRCLFLSRNPHRRHPGSLRHTKRRSPVTGSSWVASSNSDSVVKMHKPKPVRRRGPAGNLYKSSDTSYY